VSTTSYNDWNFSLNLFGIPRFSLLAIIIKNGKKHLTFANSWLYPSSANGTTKKKKKQMNSSHQTEKSTFLPSCPPFGLGGTRTIAIQKPETIDRAETDNGLPVTIRVWRTTRKGVLSAAHRLLVLSRAHEPDGSDPNDDIVTANRKKTTPQPALFSAIIVHRQQ